MQANGGFEVFGSLVEAEERSPGGHIVAVLKVCFCFGQEFLQTVDCGDGISRRLAAHQSSWALRIPEANSPPERGHNHSGTGRNARGTAPLLWWHDANYTFPGRYTKNLYLGSGVMRTCFFRAEKRNHLPVEGGQIRRLPTADPVAVSDHFTVYPLAAGIANVILDGVIAG